MKKLLIILFFIPIVTSAQIDINGWGYYPDTLTGKKDTVQITLLVTNEKNTKQAYSIKAYSVRNERCCTLENLPPSQLQLAIMRIPNKKYFVHDYYLDADKKPLPKNIKVWMTQ